MRTPTGRFIRFNILQVWWENDGFIENVATKLEEPS